MCDKHCFRGDELERLRRAAAPKTTYGCAPGTIASKASSGMTSATMSSGAGHRSRRARRRARTRARRRLSPIPMQSSSTGTAVSPGRVRIGSSQSTRNRAAHRRAQPNASRRADGRRPECVLEVGDQIAGRSMPTDSCTRSAASERRGRRGGVRHLRRHLDQALDASERLREWKGSCAATSQRRLLLRLREERDHAAEVAHLLRRDLVTGMRRQPRVETVLTCRSRRATCNRHRILTVLAHAQRQRLDPAQHEPRVERPRDRRRATSAGSRGARRSSDRSGDEAEDRVGMAAEILRRRVR